MKELQPNHACTALRTRSKVKSGCRTCKIRKVKCDEGRPACQRCLSTGRVCDGYGIWGGGGNYYGQRQRMTPKNQRSSPPRPTTAISVLVANEEDRNCFDWFKCRTVKKIPGFFVLPFWNTLVLQASLDEPAILHAVLTLSSLHKREILNAGRLPGSDPFPDDEEQFMLHHYVKSIGHLRPHFSGQHRSSVRVALITCVVFVCLEFLRGHFKTAQLHLENGLRVLSETQSASSSDDGSVPLAFAFDSIDVWINEAFSRLHVQVALFHNSHQYPKFLLYYPRPDPPMPVFGSFNEAWQQMQRLLNRIFHLGNQCVQSSVSDAYQDGNPFNLLAEQANIKAELMQWSATYEASSHNLRRQELWAFHLLHTYYEMAKIMAATCTTPDDESVFDIHTENFIALIKNAAELWKIRSSEHQIHALPGHRLNMSRSVVDMGWIPPLYYTALKCRVHRVRMQANRLLEVTSHREGIWDAKIAAAIARKVIQIEESNFYQHIDLKDDFPLFSYPSTMDLLLPTLSDSHRIRRVEVVLSDGPMDDVRLSYGQRQLSGDWETFTTEHAIS